MKFEANQYFNEFVIEQIWEGETRSGLPIALLIEVSCFSKEVLFLYQIDQEETQYCAPNIKAAEIVINKLIEEN